MDFLSGGLLGSIFGGLFRLAPEVLATSGSKTATGRKLLMRQ